ncbi:hypothetical protein LTR94_034447, partial [Friedmanniomyces endolithicus]
RTEDRPSLRPIRARTCRGCRAGRLDHRTGTRAAPDRGGRRHRGGRNARPADEAALRLCAGLSHQPSARLRSVDRAAGDGRRTRRL